MQAKKLTLWKLTTGAALAAVAFTGCLDPNAPRIETTRDNRIIDVRNGVRWDIYMGTLYGTTEEALQAECDDMGGVLMLRGVAGLAEAVCQDVDY